MTDSDLVERAIRNVRPSFNGNPRWVAVRDLFAVGSTSATSLCKRFDLDPDEELTNERRSYGKHEFS